MPHYPELKVVGWTSSYNSVQKLLKWIRKRKLDGDVIQTYLDSIHFLCQCLGKNPDEIIALGKSEALNTTGAFVDALKRQGVSERELNIRLAQVITFLGENRAW